MKSVNLSWFFPKKYVKQLYKQCFYYTALTTVSLIYFFSLTEDILLEGSDFPEVNNPTVLV